MSSGHRQLDHTADVALEIWAPDEARLLAEAAAALVELLAGGRLPAGPVEERTVELTCLDAEDRLVQWLNEILYLATVDGLLVTDSQLVLEEGRLSGRLHGVVAGAAAVKSEVKSATYHDIALIHGSDQVRARVVLDV